jgi:hypothetical protein
MPTEEEIKIILKNAINKDGEGRRIAGHNFFEETEKRLWEARENTFKKSTYTTRGCSDIYHMETTEGQVDAYYIGGEIYIAHNGQERSFAGDKVRKLQTECRTAKRLIKK